MSFFKKSEKEKQKKRIYLDYAAATPVRTEVRRAMEPYLSDEFANPSAIYEEGRIARRAVEDARVTIARIAHAGARDVIFTSGGTESDNLAIFGVVEEMREHLARPHIIVAEYEHPAVLEAARLAERRGAELSIVPAAEIASHIQENTALISLSLVNGETGEINPVSRIGRAVAEARKKSGGRYPYLHVDASQAALTQAGNVDALRADLLSLDAGKIYGPKGAGALIVRPWVRLISQTAGGGQERGLRSGTENVPGIVGLAKALELADAEREELSERMKGFRDKFVLSIREAIPEAVVNGSNTAPNIASITIPGRLHEYLAIALEERGVLVSAGSSCSSRKSDEKEALRFSFGRETGESDLVRAAEALKESLIY